MKNSYLATSKIFHCRNFPRKNSFLYQVYYLLLDLDDVNSSTKPSLLSFERFNLFSFYNKDHCKNSPNVDCKNWINDILQTENIVAKKIKILCHPRVLGYVFNPASFWFCLDEEEKLIAVLAEVQNTFGESHSYLIFNHDHSSITANQEHFAQKEFHVSPFFKRQGKYCFKFDYNHEKIKVFIDYFDEEKLMLQTSLIANLAPLNNRNLIKAFFTIPLVTFKVIILIHFQALKIILKGIKYIPKPAQLSQKITKIFK